MASTILDNKIISVAELRMALAEFTKEGVEEINLWDFLTYLLGLVKDKEPETEENSTV